MAFFIFEFEGVVFNGFFVVLEFFFVLFNFIGFFCEFGEEFIEFEFEFVGGVSEIEEEGGRIWSGYEVYENIYL